MLKIAFRWFVLTLVAVAGTNGFSLAQSAKNIPLDRIELPEGFKIEIYARGLPEARSMARGAKGTLFVGTRRLGDVYAVTDQDQDHQADKVVKIATGLFMPNGVAFRDGALYLAEVNRVLRYPDIEADLDAIPEPEVVLDGLPRERHHGWKFIRFGPDGKLYVPIGAPCNVCEKEDARFASISRVNPDGSDFEVFASGVRNTVGFDWHPETGELWFTDNGRDMMGDEIPPDELNRAEKAGMHFGFPYCHGGDIPDPKFALGHPCSQYTPPARNLGPHVAAIGMRFYTGQMFPATYRNQIIIAEHGSWNRSKKLGYRLMMVRLEGNRAISYEVFAQGWMQNERSWGRPVDVLVMPDGALLVSDDQAGAIYRVSYTGPAMGE